MSLVLGTQGPEEGGYGAGTSSLRMSSCSERTRRGDGGKMTGITAVTEAWGLRRGSAILDVSESLPCLGHWDNDSVAQMR